MTDARGTKSDTGARLISRRRRGGRAPNIHDMDFRRPAPPSRGQLQELQLLSERYGFRMKTALANYLRMPVESETIPGEIVQYDHAISSFPEGTWLIPLHSPSGERAVFTFDESLQDYIITRLLGYRPVKEEDEEEFDEDEDEKLPIVIGEVSRAVMNPFLTSLIREMNSVFLEKGSQDLFEVDEARRLLASHRMMRGADTVVRFGVKLKEGTEEGHIGLLIQHRTVMPLLSVNDEAPAADVDAPGMGRLESVVRDLDMMVSATLGSATIMLQEFLKLEPGDVLILDRKVGEPLDVKVGSEVQFTGQPGRSGGRLAVRILARKERREST